jgi:hypothetical protein
MKIRNLKRRIARKIAACVVAAGFCLSGSVLYAVDIPLRDPSFEDYDVAALSADGGYAYSDEYRPTSAWVDDPGFAIPPSTYYAEDDGNSNWLYTAAYGSGFRPTPRTGNQAMHGIGYYSGQVVDAVFEAGMTYTFSLWAQGDNDASDSSSRVWLYFYDGTVGLPDGQLAFQRFAPDTGDFVNRDMNATDAESQAMWTQIGLSYTVLPGSPEIGNPIGVAFWQAADGAVDDASLTVIPEPTTVILAGIGGLLLLTRRRP